jgi:hypothetical protein
MVVVGTTIPRDHTRGDERCEHDAQRPAPRHGRGHTRRARGGSDGLGAHPVAAARNRFDISRLPPAIAEGGANLADAVVQRIVNLHVRGLAPHGASHLIVRHEFAGPRRQGRQYAGGLRLEPYDVARAPDFTGRTVKLGSIDESEGRHLAYDEAFARAVPDSDDGARPRNREGPACRISLRCVGGCTSEISSGPGQLRPFHAARRPEKPCNRADWRHST